MKLITGGNLMPVIDNYSYHLGAADCFCEMVAAGVKKIALSHPCDSKELRDSFIKKSYEYMLSTFGNMKSKYKLSRYTGDFIYFHPQLLKLYLILKGKK